MPARPARAEWSFPSSLGVFLGAFPEHEVVRLFLFVLVRVDAGAYLELSTIEPGQPAISWKTRNAKVNRVALPIRVAAREETLDEVDHLRDVVRGRRDDVRLLDPQLRAVLEKCRGVRGGVLADADSLLCRFSNDLVVDVGDVHHMDELPLALEMPTQNIFKNVGAEVSDMREIVHGRPACV